MSAPTTLRSFQPSSMSTAQLAPVSFLVRYCGTPTRCARSNFAVARLV